MGLKLMSMALLMTLGACDECKYVGSGKSENLVVRGSEPVIVIRNFDSNNSIVEIKITPAPKPPTANVQMITPFVMPLMITPETGKGSGSSGSTGSAGSAGKPSKAEKEP